MLSTSCITPTVLFTLTLAFLGSGSVSADPCADLAFNEDPKPSDVLACYTSFPFNATRRDQTLDSLKIMFQQYANDDIAKHPPNPSINTPFDIQAIISSFEGKSFSSDHEFQRSLHLATLKSNDGHTRFIPRCYGTYNARLPFYLGQVALGSSLSKIFIAGIASSAPKSLAKWNGAEVVAIDGKRPDQVLQEYVDVNVGGSKEPLTRLAQALVAPIWNAKTKAFDVRTGYFTSRTILPSSDTITFSLRQGPSSTHPTDVTVPFTMKAPPTKFTSASSYWSTFCSPYSFADLVKGRSDPAKLDSTYLITDPAKDVSFATSVSVSISPPSGNLNQTEKNASSIHLVPSVSSPALVASGTGFAFFTQTLQDGKTLVGILTIAEMGLWDASWMKGFASGIKGIKDAGARRLIIDVTDNLGGNICTAKAFASAFKQPSSKSFPDLDRPWVTHIRSTPLARLFSNVSISTNSPSTYNPDIYLNRSGKPWSSTMASFIPGISLGLDGLFPFTDGLVDKCDGSSIPDDLVQPFNSGETAWDPKDIVILSNGLCGSSCAQLVQYLSRVLGVKIVSAGGSGSLSSRGVVSYAGGQAFTYSEFAEMVFGLNLDNHPSVYKPIPVRCEVGTTVRTTESYTNPSKIMEYDGLTGDYQMDYTAIQILGVGERWAQAYTAAWGASNSSTQSSSKPDDDWSPLGFTE
ncbi:MAG: hypothetical protein DHS80DRAFT_21101 [Piptocephalis tieghemiana]|nr:MAG: hypothetical protein DHS80DRAFT_21101 [Piptocephalis tieghemiana]